MNTRNKGIAQVLRSNPHAQPMLAVMSRECKVSGMGYEVEHVQPGGGFSCTEYSSKSLQNGRTVALTTYYPGPFDGLAGYSTEITERYYVWVGWDEYNEEVETLHDAPPMDLPAGAIGWDCRNYDGPENWFAEFDDAEMAEAFANSLPPYKEGEDIKPFLRN